MALHAVILYLDKCNRVNKAFNKINRSNIWFCPKVNPRKRSSAYETFY
jgi:hypothetical protein